MKIFRPPQVVIKLQGRSHKKAVAQGELLSYDKLPGEAIGTAIVQYTPETADDFDPEMGKLADIYVGGDKVFAGYVVDAPATVGSEQDVSQLVIADVKGLLRGRFVGAEEVSEREDGAGFDQVGFEIVFNREGFGDKDPDALKWSGGSTAVAWTCANILQWLFTHYVPAAIGTLAAAPTGAGWLREPAYLTLSGMTVLAAIDTVAQLAGEGWDLHPVATATEYARIAAGVGTEKTVRLFQPGRGADASDAGVWHATGVEIRPSVQGAFDRFEAQSGAGVIETMFGTSAAYNASLVKQAATTDVKYVARYAIDVTKYALRKAGLALAAGSRPKPLMPWLVTRVTAAGAVSDPPYAAAAERFKGPIVWIVPDATVEGTKPLQVEDGYKLDLDWSTIEFEPKIKVVGSADGEKDELTIADWSKAGVYLTAAVRIETRQVSFEEADVALPIEQVALVSRPDLAPEWRWKSAIPADEVAGFLLLSNEADPELCVETRDKLLAAAESAAANAPAYQRNGELRFATVPAIFPGDRVLIRGRTLPTGTASLSVTDVRMSCVDGVPDEVRVAISNAPVACDPKNYLSSRRAQ